MKFQIQSLWALPLVGLLLTGCEVTNQSDSNTSLANELAVGETTCFEFLSNQGPYGSSKILNEDKVDTWCYQEEKGETFVFNVDSIELNQNIAAMVEHDKDGAPEFVTTIANVKGKQTRHRSSAKELSPIGVPLSVTEAAGQAKKVVTPNFSLESRNAILNLLKSNLLQISNTDRSLYQLTPGRFTKNLSDDLLPWDSDYYPFGESIIDVLGVFDRFVENGLGLNSDAQAWEEREHVPSYLSGHCNGWAADQLEVSLPLTAFNTSWQ